MANSNNWGEIYKSTWWGDKAWSANTLFIDSAPPGFGLNLLKASEDMNITLDWSQTLISVAANSTDEAAPNGTDTAEKLTFTDNRQSRIQQQIALEANTTYTFSVYAKVRTGTKAFRLRNVTLGQAQQFTADTSWGLNPDDGRYSFSFTTGATAITHTLSIQNAASAGTGEVFFWGAMLNEGATAGDYVKTDASVGGSAPTPAYSGFGDVFGGATAYYSLRKFTEAETLNAIRVRRSSDDTEQDIGFDANGDLDSTALLAFVGTGGADNGFVTTWYDQSGNGNDANNINESEQPLVVSGGTLVEENGKAAIQFDNSDDYLDTSFVIGSTTDFSAFTVVNMKDLSSLKYIWDARDGSTDGLTIFADPFAGNPAIRARVNATTLTEYPLVSDTQYLLSTITNSTEFIFSTNGDTPLSGASSAINTTTNLRIGRASYVSSGVMNGNFSELILFNSDQSSNRTGIETNINDHFDIYTP